MEEDKRPNFETGVPTYLLNLDEETRNRLAQDKANELGQNYQLQKADVLCGNRPIRDHPGNARFNVIVQMRLDRYRAATTKSEKTTIVKEIVDATRASGGNFVKQESNGVWYDIGNIKAREKASNALRSFMAGARRQSSTRRDSSFSTDTDVASAAAAATSGQLAEEEDEDATRRHDRRKRRSAKEMTGEQDKSIQRYDKGVTPDAPKSVAVSSAASTTRLLDESNPHTRPGATQSFDTNHGDESNKRRLLDGESFHMSSLLSERSRAVEGIDGGGGTKPAEDLTKAFAFSSSSDTARPASYSEHNQPNALISGGEETLRQAMFPTPEHSPTPSSGSSGDKKKKSSPST